MISWIKKRYLLVNKENDQKYIGDYDKKVVFPVDNNIKLYIFDVINKQTNNVWMVIAPSQKVIINSVYYTLYKENIQEGGLKYTRMKRKKSRGKKKGFK